MFSQSKYFQGKNLILLVYNYKYIIYIYFCIFSIKRYISFIKHNCLGYFVAVLKKKYNINIKIYDENYTFSFINLCIRKFKYKTQMP
jgi:hypothetical protein